MTKSTNTYRHIGICLFLILTTWAVYGPIRNYDFISFDDDEYVTNNIHVQSGLTAGGFVWSFTQSHASNWHPLTWLSHMLDWQLYADTAGGHHLTSLLFHILNTLWLFFVLHKMTGSFWRSGFVAAVFALHPLHVESVAWIAERKDVLSGFFWMLTLLAYFYYVRRGRLGWYILTMVLYSLGLMTKSMLITLPAVFLLLDYWPLGRWLRVDSPLTPPGTDTAEPRRRLTARRLTARRLIGEKIPFFMLAALSGVITIYVQRGAITDFINIPLSSRLANVPISYFKYLLKMFWPVRLAVFYPHVSNELPWWQVTAILMVLVGLTALIFIRGRKSKYLPVGWLWYLGTLVPVIGLVQVGLQAMADRYTYLPAIGIFIMLAWGADELLAKWRYRKAALSIAGSAALAGLMIISSRQVGYWKDNFTLYGHALAVTQNNFIIHNNLGSALAAEDKLQEAAEQFRQALDIAPHYPSSLYNLAHALALQDNYREAIPFYRTLLEFMPDDLAARLGLAQALVNVGNPQEAIKQYRLAINQAPNDPAAYDGLAWILANHPSTAVRNASAAVGLAQKAAQLTGYQDGSILETLAGAYAAAGQRDWAIKTAQQALQLALTAHLEDHAERLRRQIESYQSLPPSGSD